MPVLLLWDHSDDPDKATLALAPPVTPPFLSIPKLK